MDLRWVYASLVTTTISMILKVLRALVCVCAIHLAYITFHKEIANLLDYIYPSVMFSNTLTPKSSFKLTSGYDMPKLGLGTWLSKPGEVGQAIIDAYDIGYRHFDCAALYRNEAEIGNALKEIFSKKNVNVVLHPCDIGLRRVQPLLFFRKMSSSCLRQSGKIYSLPLKYGTPSIHIKRLVNALKRHSRICSWIIWTCTSFTFLWVMLKVVAWIPRYMRCFEQSLSRMTTKTFLGCKRQNCLFER